MWKAENISLSSNFDYGKDRELVLKNSFTLRINGVLVHNNVGTNLTLPTPGFMFQACVCDYCGEEGCNPGGYLMLRRHGTNLLILPVFDLMETLEEFEPDSAKGERDGPPHEWFDKGILVLEEDMVKVLLSKMKGLAEERIAEITDAEMNEVIEWERLVREKPPGFMVAQQQRINQSTKHVKGAGL